MLDKSAELLGDEFDVATLDAFRRSILNEAIANELPYATFYFDQCKEHLERTVKHVQNVLPDRSAFVYAMQ